MGITKDSKWVHKNGKEKRVSLNQINERLENGWKLGRVKGIKCMHKDGDEKRVYFNKKDEIEKDGWKSGRSEESKRKNSESQKGKIPWNKGILASEEAKQKLRENAANNPNSGMKNKNHSKETIKIQRIAAIGRIEENGGGIKFNKKSIPFFEEFDEMTNTEGFYGKNEYHIKETRYQVDYFNQDLHLIIEWDEEAHYKNNQLRKKDVKRQNKIMEKFDSDVKFIRLRQKLVINKWDETMEIIKKIVNDEPIDKDQKLVYYKENKYLQVKENENEETYFEKLLTIYE